MLEARDLTLAFGGVAALQGVSFAAGEGLITGIIGPNGAGKTTLFNCISGLYRPDGGDILLEGRSILGLPPHRIAAEGVGRTFQNLALFGSMTVLDNVLVGGHVRMQSGFLASALDLPRVGAEERAMRDRAQSLLASLRLDRHERTAVTDLSFGTRKRVELARALMGEPRLLMLDEPASGLNHAEVEEFASTLREVRRDHGLTVLLIEHHVRLVMAVSDHVVALEFGRKIAEGTPAEVQNDPAVVEAYLGGGAS